jgi:hypothetical protein
MLWPFIVAFLGIILAITVDWATGRRAIGYLFGLDPTQTLTYGDNQGYSTLTWILGIIMTQGATFAASLQLRGDPFVPIFAYAGVSILMMIGVSLMLNAKSQPGSTQRAFDYGSIAFGRWVQIALILLATASVIASLFGAIPGQSRSRKPFAQSVIQSTVQPADNPRLAGQLFGITSPRPHLDQASLDRWRTWVGSATIPADRRLLYVESAPFDSDYLPFQILIDFDNTNVAFDDAFVMLVRNAPANTITPPIYRLLGNPPVPADIGASNAMQLPLPMKLDTTHLPVFNVPEPNAGDVLVLFALVKPSAKDKAIPERGNESSMFLKLKRVN